jgi:hypothetical protein
MLLSKARLEARTEVEPHPDLHLHDRLGQLMADADSASARVAEILKSVKLKGQNG